MLRRLEIANFALLDQIDFEPGTGLCVITGETGAGKSLLIDALMAIRGERIGKDSVRHGSAKASVQALFDQIDQLHLEPLLSQFGLEAEDDCLIISREITLDGRSTARINGKLVSLSILKEIGARLVDIHGQNDQQDIFVVSRHQQLLDSFGGQEIRSLMDGYHILLSEYKECLEKIKALGLDPAARTRRAELLAYQIEELTQANLKEGEEESLKEQRQRLNNFQKLEANMQLALAALDLQEPNSPLAQLFTAAHGLDTVAQLNPEMNPILEKLKDALYELEAVESDLNASLEKAAQPEYSLTEIDARLDLLFRFKAKYGETISAMQQYLKEVEIEYHQLLSSEAFLEELHKNRIKLEKELLQQADKLHESRVKVATTLTQSINAELKDLGMAGANFDVIFQKRPKERFFSRTGYDDISFMLSSNPGEPPKPLAKIASGGEASRIMLAIKKILAEVDDTPTLVFDEVDAGISGKTADVVAQKLSSIASTHQVLCVTHMAQIAAAAQQHFFISKTTENQRTHTTLEQLSTESRREEIARLLSGDPKDKTALELAASLIQRHSDRR